MKIQSTRFMKVSAAKKNKFLRQRIDSPAVFILQLNFLHPKLNNNTGDKMKISFYDTKPYDKIFFDKENEKYGYEIRYFETKLSKKTAVLSKGCTAAVAFVNDDIDKETIDALHELGVEAITMLI